jgi:hypothetical protein
MPVHKDLQKLRRLRKKAIEANDQVEVTDLDNKILEFRSNNGIVSKGGKRSGAGRPHDGSYPPGENKKLKTSSTRRLTSSTSVSIATSQEEYVERSQKHVHRETHSVEQERKFEEILERRHTQEIPTSKPGASLIETKICRISATTTERLRSESIHECMEVFKTINKRCSERRTRAVRESIADHQKCSFLALARQCKGQMEDIDEFSEPEPVLDEWSAAVNSQLADAAQYPRRLINYSDKEQQSLDRRDDREMTAWQHKKSTWKSNHRTVDRSDTNRMEQAIFLAMDDGLTLQEIATNGNLLAVQMLSTQNGMEPTEQNFPWMSELPQLPVTSFQPNDGVDPSAIYVSASTSGFATNGVLKFPLDMFPTDIDKTKLCHIARCGGVDAAMHAITSASSIMPGEMPVFMKSFAVEIYQQLKTGGSGIKALIGQAYALWNASELVTSRYSAEGGCFSGDPEIDELLADIDDEWRRFPGANTVLHEIWVATLR